MMDKMFKHPWLIVGIIAGISLFFAFQLPRAELDNNNLRFVPKNDEARLVSAYIDDTFGSSLFILVGLERQYGTVFDQAFLMRIQDYVDRIKEIAIVGTVNSIISTDYITGDGDSLVVEPLVGADFSGAPEEIAELKRRVLSWDFYRHALISDDFSATQILVPLEITAESAGRPEVVASFLEIRDIARDMFQDLAVVYVTGMPVVSAKTIRVPAELVIHGYEMERPGQMRGISPIAASVMVAGNLNDLLQAELEAMRIAARYLAFVSNPTRLPGQPSVAEGKDKKKKYEYFDHATIQYLPNGDDVKLVKIDRQSGTFEPYLNFNIRTFAIGCGLTFELLSGQYAGINYSNLRGIRLDLAMTLRPIQRNHINWLCTPAAAECFRAAMLVDPEIARLAPRLGRDSFTWIPPGQESVDTLRDVKAVADEMRLGLTSPQEICAAKGRVLSEVLDEIEEANKMAEERGITLSTVKSNVKTNPDAIMEEKDNADA